MIQRLAAKCRSVCQLSVSGFANFEAVTTSPERWPTPSSVDRFRCSVAVVRHRYDRLSVTEGQRIQWAEMLARGDVRSRAELARKIGVSRARITQVLGSR